MIGFSRSTHTLRRLGIVTALLSTTLLACDKDATVDVDIVKSSLSREANPQVAETDKSKIVDGNANFALSLYNELTKSEDNNIFFSPFSISTALVMTWAGAVGETADEMAQALHLADAKDAVHPAFNWLNNTFDHLASKPANDKSEPFHLATANALWGQKDIAFEEPFLDTLALHYGAGMHVLDFVTNAEESRQTINSWVENKTQDKIKNLIPDGAIGPATKLVLTNAIYFKASWLNQFKTSDTEKEDFHTLQGQTVQVDMMHQRENFAAAEQDGFNVVALPYDGGSVSMFVFLPNTSLSAFEENLNDEVIEDAIEALDQYDVTLALPKFSVTLPLDLIPTLQNMGIKHAFGPMADFSGISKEIPLVITDILHKAFIAIDEDGTEAAAATAVIMGESAAARPELSMEFIADRPFFFIIRENTTGTYLFVGRVTDPS